MIGDYILHAPFFTTRLLLIIGGIIPLVVWNFIYEHESIIHRLKQLNKQTILYSLIQTIIFYPQALGIRFFPLPEMILSSILNIIGLSIYFLGVILASWARITMGKSWGLPGTWDNKRKKRLITNGPFSFSRNPIYVGVLLMCFGFELALNSYLFLLTLPLYIYFNWEIQKEEKILEIEFGSEYLLYRKKVPRFI